MKLFRRIIVFALVVAMLAGIPAYGTVVAEDAENLPIVFIYGRGTHLIDKDGNTIFPMTVDIETCAKKIVPVLAECSFTQDYDPFCEVLYEVFEEEFAGLPLDNNGEASDGSGTSFTWTDDSLRKSVRTNSKYCLYDFSFSYDWRLDPCETADVFAQYIDDVLRITGAPQVQIVARCMGGDIVMAYLNEYGCEKVDQCLFYVSTVSGVGFTGAAFAGDFQLDGDAIARFAMYLGTDPIFDLKDDTLNELVSSAVNMLNKSYALDLMLTQVNWVYNIVREDVVPRLLLATYSTYPAYWSMVGDDYYEAAKKSAFGGREDEFAGLIEKIDNYHYNIQVKANDLLLEREKKGMDVSVVTKYGMQNTPVCKEYDTVSDGTVELCHASFGATCSEVEGCFDNEYMNNAKLNGTAKYISPDKQVDCSTCLFKDYTWVIKNCSHSYFPSCINDMLVYILRYPGRMTVYNEANYPQYMVFDKESNTVSPMTNENSDTTQRWEQGLIAAVISVVKIVWQYLKQYIDEKYGTTPA